MATLPATFMRAASSSNSRGVRSIGPLGPSAEWRPSFKVTPPAEMDWSAIVRRELEVLRHALLFGAVLRTRAWTLPLLLRLRTVELPVAIVALRLWRAVLIKIAHLRPPIRKEPATANAMPPIALAAVLYICGKSAVGTRGSGGTDEMMILTAGKAAIKPFRP